MEMWKVCDKNDWLYERRYVLTELYYMDFKESLG